MLAKQGMLDGPAGIALPVVECETYEKTVFVIRIPFRGSVG
ncbi:hypothetical protein VDG1235_4460 [Verrucomicrobiia bacterium DG1235]|nr:hypothetical protein VDG1235_4460 [Verrucomicrobiae bacterium DG1235]